jgi:hypothetical protein
VDIKWVRPSTSMASCHPSHVTSASTDRLPSQPINHRRCLQTNNGLSGPYCNGLPYTGCLTPLPHCLTTKCGAQHPASAADKRVLVG